MAIVKNNTYCPRLWQEIYIHKDGGVFSCCHCKPARIGNIYEDKLINIFNNDKIRYLRNDSLKGKLTCFRQCSLLDKEEHPYIIKSLVADYGGLRRLKILFGETCNINCIMCRQDHKNRASLDYEKLIKNVDISPFEEIEIQGGEPLFINSAKKFFEYASASSKKVDFLTNGLLIDGAWAEKIAKYSSKIYFSLNAATKNTHEKVNKGSNWEKVIANIKKVRDARDKLRTDLRIHGHMTIVPGNLEEVGMFIADFEKNGFDSIDFGYDSLNLLPYLKSHASQINALQEQISSILSVMGKDIKKVGLLRLKILGLYHSK